MSIPNAIGRSKPVPDFLMYDGDMEAVMCPLGMQNPDETRAGCILPRDSLIDESQRPMTSNVGSPGVIDTSTSAQTGVIPSMKDVYTLTILTFEAIKYPPLLLFLYYDNKVPGRIVATIENKFRQ